MPERFGDALRSERRNAKKTLGDVAKLLNVSAVYVSDVERGNRRPFNNERILKIARLLEADPAPLIAAAHVERGVIEYDITKAKPLEADVVGRPRQWPSPRWRHRRSAQEDQADPEGLRLGTRYRTMPRRLSGARADRGYSYVRVERIAAYVREQLDLAPGEAITRWICSKDSTTSQCRTGLTDDSASRRCDWDRRFGRVHKVRRRPPGD